MYRYLFGAPGAGMGTADFALSLPRAGKDPAGRVIQSNNKPVAGGVPVFLLEDWQPLTGLQTYRVYWVDLESAKVLKDYLTAYSDLKIELSGPGKGENKRVLFGERIRFSRRAKMDGEVIMLGPDLPGRRHQANVLYPTLIYEGSSEFVDESSLVGINGRPFHPNTLTIMPLMHLQENGPRYRVAKVVKYSWQPVIPLAIIKDVVEISCSFVNAGKQ